MKRQLTETQQNKPWLFWRWWEFGYPTPLIRRLYVLRCPWFSVMVHWHYRPDADRALHNHPWSFLSLIVRGGYDEVRAKRDGDVMRHAIPVRVRWFNFKRQGVDYHQILEVEPGTVSLLLAGPKTGSWGFWWNGGHVPHREFKDKHDGQAGV